MTEPDAGSPRQRDVKRRFDRAAASHAGSDFVSRATAAGLLERLAPIAVDAAHILDLGCGDGSLGRALGKQYRKSRVVGVDLSHAMLRAARRARSRFSRQRDVQAAATALPFRDRSMDLVVSNLLLPWVADAPAVFAEVTRVLAKDGVFAFAALGPDSLRELRDAFEEDGTAHVRQFPDMHDLGDSLVRAGLRDPVLDIDHLRVDYRDLESLFADLTAAGARNSLAGRRSTLTGKGRIARLRERLAGQFSEQGLGVTLELVYGHAWGGTPPVRDGEFRFDVDALRGRRRG